MAYRGGRYADTFNTVQSHVVLSATPSHRVNRHLETQVNLNNVSDRPYNNGVHYTEPDENRAVPALGRTLLATARIQY